MKKIKMLLALTRPKFFIPNHGEHRHLRMHAKLAVQMGVQKSNVVISDIGHVIELSAKSITRQGKVPSGKVLVDGTGIGEVGTVVLRDRKHLAQDGMIVVIVNLSSEDGSLVTGPDILTRGFIYVKESEELIHELKDVVLNTLEEHVSFKVSDWSSLRRVIKSDLSSFLYKTTKRNPMILTVVNEI
jgi:ribonuclease J